MLVDDNMIFKEFHESRLNEHVPSQYFINQHNLVIKRNVFLTKYSKWRRQNNLPFTNLTVSQYLQWMEKHYKFPIDNEVYSHSILTSDALFQPLTVAATIYITLYPTLLNTVLQDCGLNIVSYNNCHKYMNNKGIKFHPHIY